MIFFQNSRWKFCASCESVTPPRSWHCNICNICILKREHHCMFVGYCVGHRNHRYFCLFLFYMWVSVIYCTYFNTSFLVPQLSEASWGQILKCKLNSTLKKLIIFSLFITVFFNSSENSSYFPNGYAHDWYGCIMVTSIHLLLECSFCSPTLDYSLTCLPCQFDL